jgi:nucleotide-binding universal stress UspA family protein
MDVRKQRFGQFRRIVVPTDFSLGSSKAMKFALGFACHGTTVTAVHVLDSFPYRYGTPDLCNQKRQSAWANTQVSMARWLEQGKFCSCTKVVLEGDPAPTIAKFVAANKSDLVVLSTSGRLHVSRLFLGSVAEEIFREVPCAVFALGPKCNTSTAQHLERLVFATDLEPHSLAALSKLSRLSRAFNSKIWILRAVPGGIPSRAQQSRLKKETNEQVLARADRYVAKQIERIRVAFAPPVGAITAFASRVKADAIVLGIRRGGELTRAATHIPWEVAHRVIAKASCPVLTIRG